MPDKTLREEMAALTARQELWNEKHDEHSRAVLESIDRSVSKLYDKNEEIIKAFGTLNCKEHVTIMKSNQLITNEKIESVEKRFSWLWKVAGALIVGFILYSTSTNTPGPVPYYGNPARDTTAN